MLLTNLIAMIGVCIIIVGIALAHMLLIKLIAATI